MLPHLPNELWLDTFSALPRKTLISLHSASKLFHRISRPLLFGDFDFHPFQIQDGASSRYSNQDDVDRNMKRLEFWTSPEIAPFVRGCIFSVFCRARDDPSPVFALFFKLLPHFSNLQQFSCLVVKFDRLAVEALCALPKLAQFQLTGCSLEGDVAGLVLRVESFLYVEIPGSQMAGSPSWLTILDKTVLRDLKMPSAPSPRLLLERETSDFPNVQNLTLGIRDWAEISLLSKFPSVLRFQVQWCPPLNGEQDRKPVLFTQLEAYDGPHEIILFLDPRAAPKHLNITPSDPQLLLERFFTARPILRAVELLLISLYYLQPNVLGGCLGSFPNLREFRMKVCDPVNFMMEIPDGEMHTRQTFYDSLITSSPFPQTLEKLYIVWSTQSDPHTPLALASARATRIALESAHSALKCIWLVSPEFQYLWIRQTDDELSRTTRVNARDSRIRLSFAFPDLQDPFVLRYSNI
ncbi:hypothetical protein DFH06DRAFT_609 [Mycena polygramma]|nr:hypothetical protein DFH06DRAFT_609 [Mycena polygramma]